MTPTEDGAGYQVNYGTGRPVDGIDGLKADYLAHFQDTVRQHDLDMPTEVVDMLPGGFLAMETLSSGMLSGEIAVFMLGGMRHADDGKGEPDRRQHLVTVAVPARMLARMAEAADDLLVEVRARRRVEEMLAALPDLTLDQLTEDVVRRQAEQEEQAKPG